ncbi:MAG: hypothetical protein ACP5OA_04880 [Candidatus Woesearchaeota archaeon]
MGIEQTCAEVREKFPASIKDTIQMYRLEASRHLKGWDIAFGLIKHGLFYDTIFAVQGEEHPVVFATSKNYRQEIADITKELNLPLIEMLDKDITVCGIRQPHISYMIGRQPFAKYANAAINKLREAH